MANANYRKHNDRSKSSSTYHKKDGTAVRAILSREAAKEIREAEDEKFIDQLILRDFKEFDTQGV